MRSALPYLSLLYCGQFGLRPVWIDRIYQCLAGSAIPYQIISDRGRFEPRNRGNA